MSDESHRKSSDAETSARREFMSQIGKAAVTAPAIALLVNASSQPAAAQYRGRKYGPNGNPSENGNGNGNGNGGGNGNGEGRRIHPRP
jgi:hypothetical protein